MSATDELRRMLDERGVEWRDGDASHTTEWTNANGQKCSAMYWKPTFTVLISGCTPAQAIAATLGDDGVGRSNDGVSRYYEFFGTPERAAQTMALQCFGAASEACDACVFGECDGKLRNSGAYQTVYDALLEWLRGESDD